MCVCVRMCVCTKANILSKLDISYLLTPHFFLFINTKFVPHHMSWKIIPQLPTDIASCLAHEYS